MKFAQSMKFDKPLEAILFGTLGVIPFELITQMARVLGLAKNSVFVSNSMMFLEHGNWFLGALTTPASGGIIALIIYYLVAVIGSDYLLIKATLLGMLSWGLQDIIFGTFLHLKNLDEPLSGHFSYAFGSAVFGVTVGILLKRYLLKHPSVEKRGKI